MTLPLLQPMPLSRGPTWRNRLALAPLTNQQSHTDGTLSDEEFRWLTMRAEGGFGLVMTCAAHVQAVGQGFPGQLGVFGDQHLAGLTRLATAIRAAGAVASVQLHHAGLRSPKDLVGQPVSASENPETGARALTLDEVEQLRDDFIAAAVRAERAGFDGVEVHGAHGYVLTQFLAAETNHREDRYGGALENRARLLFEVVDGVRAACRPDFQVGVRLSPERFGMKMGEALEIAQTLMRGVAIDYLDMSLWDVFKAPIEEDYKDRSLLAPFAALDRGAVRLGAAGKLKTPAQAQRALDEGCDFAVLGRAAVLHHDWPRRLAADPDFAPVETPVTPEHLMAEGLSPGFVTYMRNWPGFVTEAAA